MNTAYENASLRNPKPELLEPTHTAGRGNALDNIMSRMPAFNTVPVTTDCPKHGKQRWQVTEAVANAGNVQCQKCQWEHDAQQAKLQELKGDMLASLDIPSEHINADFSQWTVGGDDQTRARIAKIINFAKGYAANYRKGHANILLTGNTGTGKTKLACLIINEIVRQRYYAQMTVAFKRSGQIQHEIKATWDKTSSDSAASYIERLSRSTALIIDEVGEGDTSAVDKWADKDREQLSAIIDRRYQLRLPTIITTNMTDKEFYDHIGDRASDRLRQNIVQIPCVWPSYRVLTGRVRTL
ncbi:ATP-binding protein [Psychrobacter sp. Marseille-P5312]|uniref:ATP-binding protein n=1 Tax=Psychrobacter sp. Marseille-P5312 TaxID=2086574 RepID=UPI000CF6EB1B|nr:ATP-binding protein [Psychrobacter sp. Marseille-P5312]